MPEIKDLTGKKYGELTALRFSHRAKGGGKQDRTYWVFSCSCGVTKIFRIDVVRRGQVKTCGAPHNIPGPTGTLWDHFPKDSVQKRSEKESVTPLTRRIGNQLRLARLRKDLSQDEFNVRLGKLTRDGTVSAYENGKRATITGIARFCGFLDIELWEVIRRAEGGEVRDVDEENRLAQWAAGG